MKKLWLSALLGVAILAVVGGTWTSSQFLYKPSLGARGQQEKDLFDSGLDRVDTRLGCEVWLGDPNVGSTLAAAVTNIGASPRLLRLPPGTQNLTADLTIPANITLKPERGAVFSISTGKTLTINGLVEAGNYQIFSCSGTGRVYFNTTSNIPGMRLNACWWGADLTGAADSAAALNKMFDAVRPTPGSLAQKDVRCNFYLPPGYYKIAATLNLTNLYYFGLQSEPDYAAYLKLQTNGAPGLDLSGAGYYDLRHLYIYGEASNSPNVLVLQRRSLVGGSTHVPGGCGTIQDCYFDGYFTKFALANISQESNSISRCQFYSQGGTPKGLVYVTGYDKESLSSPFQTNEDLGLLGTWFKECNINAGAFPAMYFTGGFGLVSVRDCFLSASNADGVVKFYKPTSCDVAGQNGYGVQFEDTLCEGVVSKATYYVAFQNATGDTLGVNGIRIKNGNANLANTNLGLLFEGSGAAQAINFDIENLAVSPGGQAVKIDGQLVASRIVQRVYASGGYGNQHVGLQVTSYSDRNYIEMGPGSSLSLQGAGFNNTIINRRSYGTTGDSSLSVEKLKVGNARVVIVNGKPTAGDFEKGSFILNQNNDPYYDSSPVINGWNVLRAGTLGTLSGVTGTISNGTNVLTVNTNAIYVGNWIDIATVSNGPFLVAHVDEGQKKVYLDHNVTSAASNQAVTYHVPTLRAFNLGGYIYTASRPALTSDDTGYCVWDVNVGKPIWWNGSAWKLADGTNAP